MLSHLRNNAVGYLALLMVIVTAPTAAYAALAVRSSDIVDGQVKTQDLALDSVTTGRIRNGQVTGADVLESTLEQVPAALQGGLGRGGFGGNCDPETSAFMPCISGEITLAKPARLLVIGTVRAGTDLDVDEGVGMCRIVTPGSPSEGPVGIDLDDDGSNFDQSEELTLVTVTGVLPAGDQTFDVECNQGAFGGINYPQVRVSAVALSAG